MINSDSLEVKISENGTIEGKTYANNTIEGEISSENLEAQISNNGNIEGEVASNNSVIGEVNNVKVGIIEAYDYNSASNKPKINGVELKGNKTLEDLGIQPKGNYLTEIPREYVDEDELNYAIKDKANKNEIPKNTSELTNDSNYATKEYVDNEIATFDFIKIVNELPDTGLENRFYFVPKADTQTQDLFDEYAWINNKWEWITTKQIEVDLTNYALRNEIPTKTSELENDNGFITDYEETDPTVPSYVKSIKETDINNWNNKVETNDINNLLNALFPIGKVEIFFDNNDHSNHLGFTWERTSIGKVPVGIDTNDTDFNAIGKTGGSKDMQKHSHSLFTTTRDSAVTWIEGVQRFAYDVAPQGHANTYVGNVGTLGTGDSGNLQPYEVMAFWKRIS